MEGAVLAAAKSVAGLPLPPVPPLKRDRDGNLPVSIVLFYQYIEPAWSEAEHKGALNFVINLARQHGVNGRGRCAPEGLNCTLSGSAQGVRAFCEGLRSWHPAFLDTDFKITDGVYYGKRFKALTIRKAAELVAYGLAGERAPSLRHSTAVHLEADKYHAMMAEKDTVVIDVRNYYENAIGHFAPPRGGAELLDPKMRNSHEFPKWLNLPETKAKLQGKQVMMYCTGGIRCERASALLDHMEKASSEVSTKGIYMVRGGIERYLQTFPEGGFWKGKNYLFDRRFEQAPDAKPAEAVEAEVESHCCLCGKPWALYRGKFQCSEPLCKVPVLVCYDCADARLPERRPPLCPLCVEGYHLRECPLPDVVGQKRKLFGGDVTAPSTPARPALAASGTGRSRKVPRRHPPSVRLFVGNLPLVVTASALKAALGGDARAVDWVVDRRSGAFYGAAFVFMQSVEAAESVVQRAAGEPGIRLAGGGRRARFLRVGFAPPADESELEKAIAKQRERPPWGSSA